MDETLLRYPFVIVRIGCDACVRHGSYRLVRLAHKYGPEITLPELLEALTADCPVVPVAVAGTDRMQPVGAKWPWPRRFSITFGEPLTFPEYRGQAGNGKARREVTDRLMEAIATLSGQEKAGW